MATRQHKRGFAHRLILPTLTVAALFYFGFHTINGAFGLNSLRTITLEVAERQHTLDALREERERLALRVTLLRPDILDQELVDEFARAKLSVVHPNDVVILVQQ